MLLEGALLESRVGNIQSARKVFRFLNEKLTHGPIFYEAYKAEVNYEEYENALIIVEKGLNLLPKYGPLWFASFYLLEKLSIINKEEGGKGDLTKLRDFIEKSVLTISKELIWKVYFEGGQIEERAGNLNLARQYYIQSAINAIPTLRWKVWLSAARLELLENKEEITKIFLNKALEEVPIKTKSIVLVECARVEEYFNNLLKAREYIDRAKKEAKHEWKVFLESILLEMRAGNIKGAIKEVLEALNIP